MVADIFTQPPHHKKVSYGPEITCYNLTPWFVSKTSFGKYWLYCYFRKKLSKTKEKPEFIKARILKTFDHDLFRDYWITENRYFTIY